MTDLSIETPELDRQKEIIDSGRAEAVQQFLDWLWNEGLHLCSTDGHEFIPHHRQPEQLMADHFGIDRDKIEDERRAILANLRGEA